MGEHSTRAFTTDKLKKMGASGSAPGNLDSDRNTRSDHYGKPAAHDASDFAKGGLVGKGKRPHLGRVGRATGGRLNGELVRTQKTGKEIFEDNQHEGETLDDMPAADGHDDKKDAVKTKLREGPGREGRARGGRTGKGKTVVNVIIGGDKHQPGQPMPVPVPAGGPPPMPPPKPPMPPPGAGASPALAAAGPPGAPMGAAGSPPGGMPGGIPPQLMGRARGGRIDGHKDFGKGGTHSFGKGGTKAQAAIKETAGAGGGQGRMEKARRQR